jgi:sugar phosphate permease
LALRLRIPRHRTDLGPNAHLPTMREVWQQMVDGVRRTFAIPTLKWMLVSGVLISFAAGGYITWIVDFTVQVKGMSQAQARPFYALTALTGGVAGVLAGGFVGDRWQARSPRGRVLTIALGFFCGFPFCVGVMLIDHGLPYYVTGWFLMFFLPFYNGPMAAVIDDVVDDDKASTAQASFSFFLHLLGSGPSAFIVGWLSTHVNLQNALMLPTICTALSAGFCVYSTRFIEADMEARKQRALARRAA